MSFNLEQIKAGLDSDLIDVPKHNTIDERANWLWDLMQKHKSGIALEIPDGSDKDEIHRLMKENRIERRKEREK